MAGLSYKAAIPFLTSKDLYSKLPLNCREDFAKGKENCNWQIKIDLEIL